MHPSRTHLPIPIDPPLGGRPRHVVPLGGPSDRPATLHDQSGEPQTSSRGECSVSVGHEDLLGEERFLDSSTPRPEVFAFQAHSDRVVTRPRPTCPISTARPSGRYFASRCAFPSVGEVWLMPIAARMVGITSG